MRAAILLQDLTGRGVTLEAHGPELIVDGPADALSDEVVETLKAVKTELLVLLSSGADKPDWQASFDEDGSGALREGCAAPPATLPPATLQRSPPSPPAVSETLYREGGEAGFVGTRGEHRRNVSPAPAAGGPAAWREALLALSPDIDPCPGFRRNAWARVWANALDFIERHGAEAHRLGWTAPELFGVHPVVGVIRVDHCGALMLTVPGRAVAVEASAIRYNNELTFRRPPEPLPSIPVWQFAAR